MELAFVPLTVREVVQLSDTDRNKIQLSVLIPLTVGEVIQQWALIITADMGFTQMWAFLSYE